MTSHLQDWQADFAIFSADGQLAAIAEAKKTPNIGLPWAEAWLRNYLARQQSSSPPFVILATPEKVYLWRRPSPASLEPTAVTDARGLFAAYLPPSVSSASDLSGQTFEFVVGAWLDDMSHHLWEPAAPEEINALRETGLLNAIAGGRVVADVAA